VEPRGGWVRVDAEWTVRFLPWRDGSRSAWIAASLVGEEAARRRKEATRRRKEVARPRACCVTDRRRKSHVRDGEVDEKRRGHGDASVDALVVLLRSSIYICICLCLATE
jgi:hypothetical protein